MIQLPVNYFIDAQIKQKKKTNTVLQSCQNMPAATTFHHPPKNMPSFPNVYVTIFSTEAWNSEK